MSIGSEYDVIHLDHVGMVYYRQGTAVVESIESGDIASAEGGIRALEALEPPTAAVVAYVQNSIGVAYVGSRRFEAAIEHHEEALRVDDGTMPGLWESSHGSLVYSHVALGHYETAERLLASRGTQWAWLLTSLASLYADRGRIECALVLGERALELGRAGAAVNPYEPMTVEVDRDAVLRRWSERVDGMRHASTGAPASGTDPGEASAIPCVGADVEHLVVPSPEPEP
ncbi:MAG: tetratricopeptide repeat protein [Gammaproteobacteria bacterium]|nr:tetratricopeptide repeat protein [Gammaproteobacteria bacterium]